LRSSRALDFVRQELVFDRKPELELVNMQKLQELKKKQQEALAAKQATPTTTSATPSTTTTNEQEGKVADSTTGYILKRQNSKELAEKRRQKSKESVFTLRRSDGGKKDKRKTKQNTAELRVHKDLSEMEPIEGTRLEFPNPDNILFFNLHVKPSEGLYKGAEFKFSVTVPLTYPYDPPKAQCDTMIYHPNIDYDGHVCLNILRAEWMPVLNLGAVVFGLLTLFLQPNPDDPLQKEVAQLMVDNYSQFEKNVQQALKGGYVAGRQYPKLLK